MISPVKRVEIQAGKQKYGTAGSASTCNSGDTHETDIDLSRGSKRRRSSHTWPYGRDNGKTRTHSTIDNSTCAIIVRSFVNIQDSCQCRMCSHPASSRPWPADRYAPSGLPIPPLRGGPLLVKPWTATPVSRPGRHPHRETRHSRTAGTGMSWTAFPRAPANTKKSLRTIPRLKTLSKHGGFLLSHLVWQYHRR